jgi:predicted short-subunit dehydrogenase-like oxidoreductase (DUF2520 family)
VPDVSPPGWPSALVTPAHPEFSEHAVKWLLDAGPAEYRSHEVFRRHPMVLAHVVAAHVEATLMGARTAYASARRELDGLVDAQVVEGTLRALEREGARLVALQREVALVAEALHGTRWRPRL